MVATVAVHSVSVAGSRYSHIIKIAPIKGVIFICFHIVYIVHLIYESDTAHNRQSRSISLRRGAITGSTCLTTTRKATIMVPPRN